MTRPARFLWIASGIVATSAVVAVAVYLRIPAERAAAEPWRESPDWTGTEVSSGVAVPNPVRKAFEADPPAPENRRALFGGSSASNSPHQCTGWRAMVDSVAADPDGWNVVLTVSPRFKSGLVFTNSTLNETWHVSASGRARCDKCEAARHRMDCISSLVTRGRPE